jgi:hypothetical protein
MTRLCNRSPPMHCVTHTLIPALLIAVTLAACAPSPTPPSSGVGRIIWSIRNPPPPTATPDVSDHLCADAYAERGDALPDAFATQVAAADPAIPLNEVFFSAAESATGALDIPQTSFSVTTTNLSGGSILIATAWCAPYAGQDVFAVSDDLQTWHLAHMPNGATNIDLWLGADTAVIWANAPRGLLRRQQVWIAEKGEDGWAVVYEATRPVGPNGSPPAELALGRGQATVDYTLESGERVVQTFSMSSGGVWSLTGEQRIDPDS